jgi:hypothetical protein
MVTFTVKLFFNIYTNTNEFKNLSFPVDKYPNFATERSIQKAFIEVDANIPIGKLKSIVKKKFNEDKLFRERIFKKYNKNFENMEIILMQRGKKLENEVGKDGKLVEFFKKVKAQSLVRELEKGKVCEAGIIHMLFEEDKKGIL